MNKTIVISDATTDMSFSSDTFEFTAIAACCYLKQLIIDDKELADKTRFHARAIAILDQLIKHTALLTLEQFEQDMSKVCDILSTKCEWTNIAFKVL